MSEKKTFERRLKLALPANQSLFLWGARKTGKTTLLRTLFPNAIWYDLLKTDTYFRLVKAPQKLREEIEALPEEKRRMPVIIDEVQKIPRLLDEIHWLIEHAGIRFILCGSSARKLKRGAANLLGGRAWRFTLFPLISAEIPDFDLLTALNTGLIPDHYQSGFPSRSLKAYVQDYLKEEIQAEGLVRNLPAFAKFLDSMAFTNGELVNYSNIARDCGVDSKTVKEYYQILEDTLLGYFLSPFNKRKKRDIVSSVPKFYLFDLGVANFLSRQTILALAGPWAGKAFEHFIFLELMAWNALNELDYPFFYWRTKTGLEVDLVIGEAKTAIEIKLSQDVRSGDLKGLKAFLEEFPNCNGIVVSQEARTRKIKTDRGVTITIYPWQVFLKNLWANATVR